MPKQQQKSLQKKITFITCNQMLGNGKDIETMDNFLGQYSPQATILLPFLKDRGHDVHIVSWQDDTVNWKELGLLVMCTAWKYNQKLDKFIKLMDYFQRQNIQLINNAKLIKWNATKKYLKDLEEHNILIPDTLLFESGSEIQLKQALIKFENRFYHSDVIIKGLADMLAVGYLHIKQENFEQAVIHFQRLKKEFGGVVMQSFLPEVGRKSQFSFVLFNGKLSHFYIKVPEINCEKVHPQYGGNSYCIKKDLSNIRKLIKDAKKFRQDFELTEEEIRLMSKQIDEVYPKLIEVLRKLELGPPAFIRIDCVLVKNRLMIMELEAVQPYLMLSESTQTDPENNSISAYIKEVIEPFLNHI